MFHFVLFTRQMRPIYVSFNCIPFNLFVQAKLERCVGLVQRFKDGTLEDGVSNKELWEALKVKQVCEINYFETLFK